MKNVYLYNVPVKYAHTALSEMEKDCCNLIKSKRYEEARTMLYDMNSMLTAIMDAEEEGDEE